MQQLINYIIDTLLAIDGMVLLLVMLADILSKDLHVRANIGKALFATATITLILIYSGVYL